MNSALPIAMALLLGNTRPNWKFWVTQLFAFIILACASPFLLIAASFYFSSSPQGLPLTPLLVLAFIFPIAACILHAVATFRTANYTKSRTGKLASRAYPFGFVILSVWIVAYVSLFNIEHREYRIRQAEAKIGLAKIFQGQKSLFDSHGRYALSETEIGLDPENQIGHYYRYAVVVCKNSERLNSAILVNLDKKNRPMDPDLTEHLRRFSASESCEGRKDGFTAFAAARSMEDIGRIDVWRTDESNNLKNFQKGY